MTDVSVNITGLKTQKLQTWIMALRAPFFTASIIPLVVGMAIAFHETSSLDLSLAVLTLIAGISIQAGTNLANDYFDQSADSINTNYSQFNGGSRMIQNEIIPPRTIFLVSMVCYLIGIITAIIILFITQGWLLLIFLAIAVVLGYFYTALPVSLSYKGLGELAVFVGFGPLGVFSAYYIQQGNINSPLLAISSIPIAILISMLLFINEFQDRESDERAGKTTLVVVLGKERSVLIYAIGMVVSYLVLLIAILTSILPFLLILPMLTIPITIKAISVSLKHYNDIIELLPANGMTVMIHFSFGLLMAVGFVLS
ncbi:MAG: 1,4-dihydroxy-2-naphthoate octaprenyltransferase [Candidatus Hodarchaeales archaeon]|jgi:1,4-dihydroxy-2-naphthoate octaprenyltransferase